MGRWQRSSRSPHSQAKVARGPRQILRRRLRVLKTPERQKWLMTAHTRHASQRDCSFQASRQELPGLAGSSPAGASDRPLTHAVSARPKFWSKFCSNLGNIFAARKLSICSLSTSRSLYSWWYCTRVTATAVKMSGTQPVGVYAVRVPPGDIMVPAVPNAAAMVSATTIATAHPPGTDGYSSV